MEGNRDRLPSGPTAKCGLLAQGSADSGQEDAKVCDRVLLACVYLGQSMAKEDDEWYASSSSSLLAYEDAKVACCNCQVWEWPQKFGSKVARQEACAGAL